MALRSHTTQGVCCELYFIEVILKSQCPVRDKININIKIISFVRAFIADNPYKLGSHPFLLNKKENVFKARLELITGRESPRLAPDLSFWNQLYIDPKGDILT